MCCNRICIGTNTCAIMFLIAKDIILIKEKSIKLIIVLVIAIFAIICSYVVGDILKIWKILFVSGALAKKIPAKIKCNKCRADNDADSEYCNKCGNKLND